MNANPLTDDDPAVEDEPDAAVRRRAREAIERAEATCEPPEAFERHRVREELVAFLDQQRSVPDYQTRKAPIQDREARQQADLLCRVVDSAPAVTARPVSRAPLLSKNPTWAKSREPWARYADALEQVIGEILGKLQKRHASAEERTTSTEARLAQVEARLGVIESKNVIIEHEKQPGQ